VSVPKLFAPDTTLPDTVEAAHSPSPSICMGEDVSVPHFTKVSCTHRECWVPSLGPTPIKSCAT